jgi:cation diffusion facilitator CzcD-associated flavoprotein CzcO
MDRTSLLVIGAGPYGLSIAALARERGIDTTVLGHPMGFWNEHMPAGMFLRSGSDWHLDASGVHTLEAYLEVRGIDATDVDPIPLSLFVDYADWFRHTKGVEVREDLVRDVTRPNGRFEAILESGAVIEADTVVAAPGISSFTSLPPWSERITQDRGAHTCDLVRFDDLSGARVLIVGGRQSAYEWAALIGERGAERIDVVHRHDVPRFGKVSWKFVDEYIDETLRTRGWWRRLPQEERDTIERKFWKVGRLTLEWWLTPRLARDSIHSWPGTEVVGIDQQTAALSNGERLPVDRVVFATGYKADLARVPYLRSMKIEVADGFPLLNESFQTSVPGLYVTGFAAIRDFGPFFGFVKGAAAAASLVCAGVTASSPESIEKA